MELIKKVVFFFILFGELWASASQKLSLSQSINAVDAAGQAYIAKCSQGKNATTQALNLIAQIKQDLVEAADIIESCGIKFIEGDEKVGAPKLKKLSTTFFKR